MNQEKNQYWLGKKTRLEILKDGKKLFFTGEILESTPLSLTFIDRDKKVFCFSREQIKQMTEIKGDIK